MKAISMDKLLKMVLDYEHRILEIESMIPKFIDSREYDVANKLYQKQLILKSVIKDLKNLL